MTHNPELRKKINQILREIGEYADLDALAVVNREGMKISFFAKKGIDPDLLSAISAAILSTGEKVVSYNEQGGLLEVLVRGEKGFTILSNAGEYILIGTSLELNSMGLTIRVLRKYASKLQDIISGDVSDEIGPISLD
jgi:predicted regulator of Ras-like GTPase activity (Roadblock/LC7/MglB family)